MRPALSFLALSALLAVGGCGTRDSIDDSERILLVPIVHKMAKAAAYQRAELWVSESFISGKIVTDLRQPDAGILVMKPMIAWTPEGQYGGERVSSRYAMRIDSIDNRTAIRFILAGGEGSLHYRPGTYPPPSEMARIRRHWKGLAISLASALGGTAELPPEPAAAPEPERPSAPAGKGGAR